MANQIRYLLGLALPLATISAFAQITNSTEVTVPPYVLPRTIASALKAEAHCPGNLAGIPLRLVNGHQMIVTVSVNHSGPYNFLLDTGTQSTMVDSSIAIGLHLTAQGPFVVVGVGSNQTASLAQLDLLEVGSHAVSNQKALVYDLRNLRLADLRIQGILGEDFLKHFDMLIDNVHSLLCLDNSSAMRADISGSHTALLPPAEDSDAFELPNLIIVEARLSDATRPVRLMLDSGAHRAILFNTSKYLAPPQRGYVRGTGVDGRQLIFAALPAQHVRIGSLELSGVPFVSLAGNQKDSLEKGFDGVLTTAIFRRVFICHSDHFVILEPR